MNIAFRTLSIAVLVSFAMLSPAARAAEKATPIVLGMEDSWAPYARPDGTGMAPELLKAAFNAVGVDVTFSVKPYARILEEVESGALLGGFNVARQPSTEERFLFGKENLFIAESHFFVKKGTQMKKKGTQDPAEKPEDLGSGERVGLINGYEYGEAVEKNKDIVISKVNTQKQNLDKLLAPIPRLDAVVYFDKEANDLFRDEIAKGSMKEGDVVSAFASTPSIIHVAFSHKHPESKEYAELLDEGLKKIRASGEYQKIVDKY